MAQLPLYYKNSKPTGPRTSTKKWKEYYLLVITIVGFIILIAGVLWFVPGLEEDKSYIKAYDSFTALGSIDVTNPNLKPTPKQQDIVLDRNPDFGQDPRSRKLEQEGIPVPGRGRPNYIEKNTKEETPVRERVNNDAAAANHNEGEVLDTNRDNIAQVESNPGGGTEDEETRKRREKVVDVSFLLFSLRVCTSCYVCSQSFPYL